MSDQPYVNLLDPEFYVEPWDAYRWLRDNAPVFWDPVQKLWGISRFEDVMHVEKHAPRYASYQGSRPHIDQTANTSMIDQDDPLHQSHRALIHRRFTPRAVSTQEDEVREVARGLVDAVAAKGECEAVETLASRLPAIMIGRRLGYAPEDWERVRHWSESTMYQGGQTDPEGGPFPVGEDIGKAMLDFVEHTLPIVHDRRAEPRADLISIWTQAERYGAGRPWTDSEILEECLLVLDGGAETTRTVIGAIVRELALQPDQRQLLLDDPGMLGRTAVEEFIRWVSPILNMRRTVTEDHELHGQQLRAGDELLLMYASANRDDREFENPDVFDVTRPIGLQLAFGIGTHFCLGASFARLEIRVMVEEMLSRIPDWRLAEDKPAPQILAATFARAYDEVHIEFTPDGSI
jgi:cytochrome P450 family 142 subfamily A polypeptide 1